MKKEFWLSIVPALLIISFAFVVLINNQSIAVALAEQYSDSENVSEDTAALFDYFKSDAEMPKAFDEDEASHLEDVKKVFKVVNIVFVLLLISFIAVMPFAKIPLLFIRGGIYAIILSFVFAIMPFSGFFTLMHKVIFPQGNWQFPADSTLISYYPSMFWNQYYLISGIIIITLSLLFIGAGWLLKKKAIVSNT
jgi:integral membrane protein (TIGR01906 family)